MRAGANLSRLALIAEVVRHGGPRLVEAMVVPATLFYVCLVTVGVGAAYAAAIGWCYSAVAFRWLTGRSVPEIHLLVALGLSARTLVALGTGSTFAYFAQPVIGSAVLAIAFFASIALGRPVIARVAGQFCPMEPDVEARSGVATLFLRLTYLWGVVILLKGATTLVLMLTLPLSAFVFTTTLAVWGMTAAAIAATIALSFRTARIEHLVALMTGTGTARFVVTAAPDRPPAAPARRDRAPAGQLGGTT